MHTLVRTSTMYVYIQLRPVTSLKSEKIGPHLLSLKQSEKYHSQKEEQSQKLVFASVISSLRHPAKVRQCGNKDRLNKEGKLSSEIAFSVRAKNNVFGEAKLEIARLFKWSQIWVVGILFGYFRRLHGKTCPPNCCPNPCTAQDCHLHPGLVNNSAHWFELKMLMQRLFEVTCTVDMPC